MLPTVGRIVHYNTGVRVRPAIITGLYADGSVSSLTVFIGNPEEPVVLFHGVPFSEGPKDCCWSWPPKV